jgi:hypothetical protein
MSESKKWVKHVPGEASSVKRKSQEKVVKVKAIKVKRPPIPDEKIEELHWKYSLPTATDKMNDQHFKIWILVTEIKGYLTKAAIRPTLIPEHKYRWPELRVMLDHAIQENDPAVFEWFAEAWSKSAIRNEVRQNSSKKLGITEESKLHAFIEDWTPNMPSTGPNSPVTIDILSIIQDLQRRKELKGMRAPTQAEIVTASGKRKHGGYTPNEVRRQLGKMELLDLMSVH